MEEAALRAAAETIRRLASDDSTDRLVPTSLPGMQHYVGVSIITMAQRQLDVIGRLLDDPEAELSYRVLPQDFAQEVSSTLTSGDRVYDWRHLASVMQGVDLVFELLRRQRTIDP